MKLNHWPEPELEFGDNTHICPRVGITEYNVYDINTPPRRDSIFLGAVGTGNNLEKLNQWIDKCSNYIRATNKENKLNLRVDFCGFNSESGFKTKFIYEERICRKLSNSEIQEIIGMSSWNERVNMAVDCYYNQIKFLAQNREVDVILCVISNNLYDSLVKEGKKFWKKQLNMIKMTIL